MQPLNHALSSLPRRLALLALCVPGLLWAAAPTPPALDLLVDVRVVDEAQASGHGDYTVSTRARPADAVEALQLRVRNGEAGALRLGRALPVQWVQAAARGAAGASGAAGEGAVVNAVTWVPSGQGLWVRPAWGGGSQAVKLELRFDATTLQAQDNTPLPAQHTREAQSTLTLPLGVWTSFALTGTPVAAEAGTLSTLSLSQRGRQLMQVRVSLP